MMAMRFFFGALTAMALFCVSSPGVLFAQPFDDAVEGKYICKFKSGVTAQAAESESGKRAASLARTALGFRAGPAAQLGKLGMEVLSVDPSSAVPPRARTFSALSGNSFYQYCEPNRRYQMLRTGGFSVSGKVSTETGDPIRFPLIAAASQEYRALIGARIGLQTSSMSSCQNNICDTYFFKHLAGIAARHQRGAGAKLVERGVMPLPQKW